jgi:hypothetical protein
VNSPHIAGWQLIYMVAGLLTVITTPFVYLLLDSDVLSARFLSDADKLIAIERLRANQTGTGTYEFKWKQIREMVLDLKTYLWFAISALLNVGASVTGAFGPTLIKNFGFNQFVSDPDSTELMSSLSLAPSFKRTWQITADTYIRTRHCSTFLLGSCNLSQSSAPATSFRKRG